MGLGTDLLELQRIGLELERTRKAVEDMPAIRELAEKRKMLARLKAEATKLLALRKDVETDLADLDAEEQACNDGVAAAQARPLDGRDYRQVQELETELATFAKRLDRVAFQRAEAQQRLNTARDKEQKLLAYIPRFEASIVEDTKSARATAGEFQERIEVLTAQREKLMAQLSQEMRRSYEDAHARFNGLAIELLQNNVPSICRTTLQPSSLDQLRRAGDVSVCPYCHRIIVLSQDGE